MTASARSEVAPSVVKIGIRITLASMFGLPGFSVPSKKRASKSARVFVATSMRPFTLPSKSGLLRSLVSS